MNIPVSRIIKSSSIKRNKKYLITVYNHSYFLVRVKHVEGGRCYTDLGTMSIETMLNTGIYKIPQNIKNIKGLRFNTGKGEN